MNLYQELKERGLVYQVSNEKEVEKLLNTKGASFYAGFDPSASSLHVGNLLIITFLKRLEKAGLKPIVLIGGATGMIGDPSGKKEERALRADKEVKESTAAIKKQLIEVGKFGKGTKFVNNYDWISRTSLIEFLRGVGKNFSINEMLAKESVKNRLETGISYTEFSYMVLQAYDFLNLYQKHGCRFQVGGSDQWGNITAGIELIRKTEGKIFIQNEISSFNEIEAFGLPANTAARLRTTKSEHIKYPHGEPLALTIPLVTKSDGEKFGKSAGGAVWLEAKMISPYAFYQFWMNVDDKDAVKFLKYFTFLSLEEIKKIENDFAKAPEKREAQKILAKEVTEFVHGKSAYERAKKISEALFYGSIKDLSKKELEELLNSVETIKVGKFSSKNVVDFLVEAGVSSSKRQAREDVENKAIELNGNKIMDLNFSVSKKDLLFGKYFIVKRGKRDYRFVEMK